MTKKLRTTAVMCPSRRKFSVWLGNLPTENFHPGEVEHQRKRAKRVSLERRSKAQATDQREIYSESYNNIEKWQKKIDLYIY